jgi:hypothetical protein
MTPIKLLAFDDEDLRILSAHLQDAVLRIEDMAYLPRERRFAAVLDRFDWLGAERFGVKSRDGFERRRTALRIERVEAAQLRNIAIGETGAAELLALDFEPAAEPPSGAITLVFAGGAAVRLQVECIDAAVADLGPCWRTQIVPSHPLPEHPGASDAEMEAPTQDGPPTTSERS